MPDINCAVCAEPWDSYGAQHGDMASWEYELFRRGAGCPGCSGEPTPGISISQATESHIKSVIFGGTDNPDSFPLIHGEGVDRPHWDRPKDPVYFACDGCDAKLMGDLDDPDPKYAAWTGKARCKYFLHDWAYTESADFEGIEIGEKHYCPGCACHCSECGTGVFYNVFSVTCEILFRDTYDPGASFANPEDEFHGGLLCVDCYENASVESITEKKEK